MRLRSPTHQSGKGGLLLRRRDGRHHAFIGGAFAAMMALSACDPGYFRKPERAAEKPAVRPYCETNDCSAFPKGYHSLEFNGEWVYIPATEYLRSAISGQSSSRFTLGAAGGYRYPNNFGSELTDAIEREGQVVFGFHDGTLRPCCQALGEFYNLPALEETQASSVRFSVGGFGELELGSSERIIRSADDAPEEWKGVAQRYNLLLDQREDSGEVRTRILAWSRKPLIMGSRVKISCLESLCSIDWAVSGKAHFAEGLIVNLTLNRCPVGAQGCWSGESINAQFERIERFLADFDKMLEIMKQRPEEVVQ